MEKFINYIGIAGVAGGFLLMLSQGLNYLIKGEWTSYTLYWAADNYMGIGDTLAAHAGLMNFTEKCPLSVGIIVLGFILLWIASTIRGRYA